MFQRLLLFAIAFAFSQVVFSQDTWDLQRAVNYAINNSLSVKQATYGISNAKLDQELSQAARYPSLNAGLNLGVNGGFSIDPTTNEIVQDYFGTNSYSVSSGVTLYNGGRIKNSIKQSDIDVRAAQADADAVKNDIALQVASAYLGILLAEEQLENSTQNLTLSSQQLEQTDKLIRAGALPQNDRLDFLAQIARNEQIIVEAQNAVEINYLNLKQLLELDPNFNLRIESPDIDIEDIQEIISYDLRTIYNQALGTQPQIKADDLRKESAALGVDIAKAAALPSVSLFGNLNTYYSTVGKSLAGTEEGEPIQQPISFTTNTGQTIDGELTIPGNPRFVFEDTPYFNQIQSNFGQSIGLSVNFPIYNNRRNSVAEERARLNILNVEVQSQQSRQLLKTNIQRAIADARAARLSLDASVKTLDAAKAAYDNAEKRFNLGAINSFEFTTAKNNWDTAQVDLIRAKYQYLFNKKVVEFYQGKPMTLDYE